MKDSRLVVCLAVIQTKDLQSFRREKKADSIEI